MTVTPANKQLITSQVKTNLSDPAVQALISAAGDIPTLGEIVPPNGASIYFQFELVRLAGLIPNQELIEFTYNLDAANSTGEGTLTMPYDKAIYEEFEDYDEFRLYWGWKVDGVTPVLDANNPVVLNGFLKEVRRVNHTIEVDFYDKGVLLEKKDTASYSQAWRSDIVRELVTKAGLILYIDWVSVPGIDKQMDYSSSSSTDSSSSTSTSTDSSTSSSTDSSSSDSSSGTCDASGKGNCVSSSLICIDAYDSCGRSAYAPKERHCFVNKCASPTCNAEGKLIISVKPGVGNAGNQITCSACSADYCGKDGWELSGSFKYQLKENGSGTDPSDSSSKADSGKSYWDMLCEVVKDSAVPLMVYVHGDVCFITQVPPPSYARVYVDDSMNVVKGSMTVTDATPDLVNKVIVNYGNKSHPKHAVSIFQAAYEKYGEKSTTVDAYGKSAVDAQNLADRTLETIARDTGMSIDLQIIGVPLFTPHKWCKTKLKKYDIDTTFFLTRTNFTLNVGAAPLCEITLTEYYPTLGSADSADAKDGVISGATMDQIGQEAAGISYSGQCQTYACVEKKKTGDCYGMSDWLYTKLNAAGIKTQILQYYSPYSKSGTHRTVQIQQGGVWVDFPYRQYKISSLFRNMTTKKNVFVFKAAPS